LDWLEWLKQCTGTSTKTNWDGIALCLESFLQLCVTEQVTAFTDFCSLIYPITNPSLTHTHLHINEHIVSNLVAIFIEIFLLNVFAGSKFFHPPNGSHHCNRIYTCDSYHHRMPLCSINGSAKMKFWHNFRTWNTKYFIRFEINACQTMFTFQNYSMGLSIIRTWSAKSYKANGMPTWTFFINCII
jgi:hypothetical protein